MKTPPKITLLYKNMTIQGIGTDIIEVKRIAQAIERFGPRFLDRIFHPEEQEYCQHFQNAAHRFAGRFAAKEAIVKALGSGFRHGISWLDIEISNNSEGKPEVILSSKIEELLGSRNVLVSISHCREYATAFAICTPSST